MVQKIIISILMTTLNAQAVLPPGLQVVWRGSHQTSCPGLVEKFLAELRSVASDRLIQLEMVQPAGRIDRDLAVTPTTFEIECDPHDVERLYVIDLDRGGRMSMRYQKKALGFDAIDWLSFQERFLRPRLGNIALEPMRELTALGSDPRSSISEKPPSEASSKPRPIYSQWWFWTLLGGAAIGSYGLTRALRSGSSESINIEIR